MKAVLIAVVKVVLLVALLPLLIVGGAIGGVALWGVYVARGGWKVWA